MLLGARADDVRVDGSPTPTLNRVMARLRAKRATDAEIADVLEDLRATAPAEERAAISRVRGRVLKWGAEKNRKAQIASGIKRYIWRTQRDGRVRPMHAALDGATQRWSKPPIIRSDGTRGNPGDDYNCRCWAEPVVNRESLRIKARAERAERGRR
jgi:SPP1 gp7 family putative phage head morphogenesis protein